ncbi:MAG TPA: YgiT-type zinc finger protein [Acidobacteriota bacterium]|nr:YgiT-type zinc finger protein [Acidobacteriota bacterium]
MKCVICHGQEIEVQKVREEVKIGGDLIYVTVEVPVCQTCGERYYDRRTMRYLEEVEAKLKAGKVDLKEVGRLLVYD